MPDKSACLETYRFLKHGQYKIWTTTKREKRKKKTQKGKDKLFLPVVQVFPIKTRQQQIKISIRVLKLRHSNDIVTETDGSSFSLIKQRFFRFIKFHYRSFHLEKT